MPATSDQLTGDAALATVDGRDGVMVGDKFVAFDDMTNFMAAAIARMKAVGRSNAFAERRLEIATDLYEQLHDAGDGEQELTDTKRQLAHAHRRCLELSERRALSGDAIDALIEAGIERGRIWPGDEDAWRRKFEASPSDAVVELASPGLAGPVEAASDADEAAYRRSFAALHHMRPDEVR